MDKVELGSPYWTDFPEGLYLAQMRRREETAEGRRNRDEVDGGNDLSRYIYYLLEVSSWVVEVERWI